MHPNRNSLVKLAKNQTEDSAINFLSPPKKIKSQKLFL